MDISHSHNCFPTTMNNKLLLIQCITLLFRESQLPDLRENSAGIVKEVMANIKLPEVNLGIDHQKDILFNLRSTALSMCDKPAGYSYELSEILQRLKVNCLDEDGLYDALSDGIATELDRNGIQKICLNLKRELHDYFEQQQVMEIIKKANSELLFGRNKLTTRAFVSEVCAQLDRYKGESSDGDPAIISDISSDKPGQIAGIFKDIKKNDGGGYSMVTGYQGINRMLGGGIKRGSLVTTAALQHNFKTGLCLSVFASLALFNKPQMIDPLRTPLLVHISFEDDHDLTFNFLYRLLKENEEGGVITLDNVSDEDMELYVRSKLEANGYVTRFLRVNPSMWSYRDICNKMLQFESEGYEVHVCMADYLLKVPTTYCTGSANGEALRNMFEHVRNFMSAHKITFMTPHQVSTEAKRKFRDGENDFVKILPGGGYYAGSMQLDQVIDIEIFSHIEKLNRESYLTLQRGKHRGKFGQTPDEDLYCVYKFGMYCIPFDYGKPDTSRRRVGGGVTGSKDEVPFWETQ